MDIRKVRDVIAQGKSIYDIPLRVTFYARVSTERDEQLNSLENQVQYYTDLITSHPIWQFHPGYVDEGISGGSTRKRDSFLQMVDDAKAGMFDFIITKEISRFSRSTLDSIKYTQELLENNVAVLFQNDNINTLDTDSEFRLVVMAGVAQDELRKLSDRIKFGFRQSIRNGRILGTDNIWGYHKKDCALMVNTREAEIIRLIFDLYANKGYGTRKISGILTEMGYTSRLGNRFNTLTIRNIIMNPKYKGWYCGHKSKNINYLTKEKVHLDESEWVTYPDPSIPAIVSEELWDRANTLYKSRRREMMEHAPGVSYNNRYPYSCKIFCEEHGTTFHRRVDHLKVEDRELWQCKVYRQQGVATCSMPPISTAELNGALAGLFETHVDKNHIVYQTMDVLRDVLQPPAREKTVVSIDTEVARLQAKKMHLLDMRLDEVITKQEFTEKNEALNRQIQALEMRRENIESPKESQNFAKRLAHIKTALHKAMEPEMVRQSSLAAEIVRKITVLKGSTRAEKLLSVELVNGEIHGVVISQEKQLPHS